MTGTIWQGGAGTPAGYMGTTHANGVVFVDANGIQQADPTLLTFDQTTKKFSFPSGGTIETLAGNMIFKPGGLPGIRFAAVANAVNEFQMQGSPTSGFPYLGAIGGDANISFGFYSKGAGSIYFFSNTTASPELQVVGNAANSTRYVTITGSNGGNPKIGVLAGSLNITANIITDSGLTVGAGLTVTNGITSNAGGIFSSDIGVNGSNITLQGDTSGPNKPKKYIRAQGGSLQFLSDAYSPIGVWSDGGNLQVIGQFAANGVAPSAPAAGYGTPTGGARQISFAAGAITLPNLAAAVAQLIIDLKATGLISA